MLGDAEKARTEKARTENAASSGRGGNGENGKRGTKVQGWKWRERKTRPLVRLDYLSETTLRALTMLLKVSIRLLVVG